LFEWSTGQWAYKFPGFIQNLWQYADNCIVPTITVMYLNNRKTLR
jgi:hypothetical protein